MQERILPHTPQGVNEAAIALLRDERRGKILDTPAGEGYASQRLKELGFIVYAADLGAYDFKVSGVEFKRVDLNYPLPYEDCFFDYVYCIEGIEHLENPHHLIGEFSRVLKKNGKLVISTPNLLNVHHRWRYLLFGYADYFHSQINLPNLGKDLLEQHINPVCFPELNYILRTKGFLVEKIKTNRSILGYHWGRLWKKPLAFFFFLLAGWIIRLVALLFKKKVPLSEVLISQPLLFGEVILLKARKV